MATRAARVRLERRVHVRSWHIASFRCVAELGRYRSLADSCEPSARQIYGFTAEAIRHRRGARKVPAVNGWVAVFELYAHGHKCRNALPKNLGERRLSAQRAPKGDSAAGRAGGRRRPSRAPLPRRSQHCAYSSSVSNCKQDQPDFVLARLVRPLPRRHRFRKRQTIRHTAAATMRTARHAAGALDGPMGGLLQGLLATHSARRNPA
jgi:hypothetical protein